MLNRIVHFSLRFRGTVVALACLLVGYGLFVAAHAKLDVFPNFVPPQVEVQTEAPGLSPEQVESLVTRPLENAVNGLGQMASLRSESIPGLSVITAVFKDGTDVMVACQMLAERINEAASKLPGTANSPKISPLTSSTMDLLKFGLTSDKLSPMELRTLADWTLRPRILSVPGVARCIVFGGEVRQLQVQADPDRLRIFNLTLSDVLATVKAATSIAGAGFIENENQRILIQTDGQALTPEILGNIVILQHNTSSIRLKDVAKVTYGVEPKFGDALIQGRPGVLLSTASQFGANTMDATRALESALDEMKPMLEKQGVTLHPGLHRPATFIQASLRNIQHSLLLGGCLVAVVLFLFLGNFRTAFISLTAIPVSLLTAVILLEKFGVTLNTITLGGLAIAIGEVVDDAIIDVENIFRRLRENKSLPKPRPVFEVVFDASIEVRSAVVYATIIVALVFVPVLAMTGLQGSFFAPLALSYIIAILASLAVALTLTPALALLVFARGAGSDKESLLQKKLKSIYGRTLSGLARYPGAVAVFGVVVCIVTLCFLPSMSGEFLPDFREGHFVLGVQMAPGTSLDTMRQMGAEISKELLENKFVATVEQQIGRAEQGEDTFGSHRCEFHVELKPDVPGDDQEKLMKDIGKMLAAYPGIQSEVMTFLGDRIGETISGETAPIVVSVYGTDLNVIDQKAGEISRLMSAVPGAHDVQVKSPPGSPRLDIHLRFDRLSQYGFRPAEILEAIHAAFQGAVATQIYQNNRVEDVAVILDSAHRREPEQVGDLLVKNSQGLTIALKELADIGLATGRYSILHDNASRRQVITCRAEGRGVAALVDEFKKQITSKIHLPPGTYTVFSGAAQASAAARRELLVNSALAAVGIILLLGIVAGHWRNTLLILANIPFALVGGIIALKIMSVFGDDGEAGVNLGSLVGFVTLFGITTRNSIMMISHFDHLVKIEGVTWSLEAALRGAADRLLPILMTAVVTGIGLLPLALGRNEAGREIEGPMAIVILGGLITSTILNLLILPLLAFRFGNFSKQPANVMD